MSVSIKSPADIEGMRVAGRLAAELLDYLGPHVAPGVTTGEIDKIAHDYQVNVQKVVPATLNYAPPGHRPYPASICTSVNHVVCHGIPGDKKLKAGDIVNIDVTVIKDGWHGDTSRMYYVGAPAIQAKRLVDVTYEAMWRGIRAVKAGAQLGDIGHTIQRFAESHHFSIVREFCGHGIGRQFHEEPQVVHYGRPGTGMKLVPGMIFTIEPMINAGRAAIRALADGWTIVTADHSLSAQWEHTVLVTDSGYEVLTMSPGAPPPPRPLDAHRAPAMSLEATAALPLSGAPIESASVWRSELKAGRAALQAAFYAHPDTPRLLRDHARLVDRIVANAWTGLGAPVEAALVAVGGYGRGQLFPHSDVDVLILLPDALDAAGTEFVESFLSVLWDIGLEIGHSVRTIAECDVEMAADVTIMTSLLEHRHVAGSRRLHRAFGRAFASRLDARFFYEAKMLEQQQRHLKYHDTAYNLEPNVKESPGGLRDLQTVLWIARAAGLGQSWRELAKVGLITMLEARTVSRQERMIGALRVRLHYLSARREDRLVFDQQKALARELGLADTAAKGASEQLMQRYYRAAKLVRQVNVILLQNLHARLFPVAAEPVPIDDDFQSIDELLDVRDEALFERRPSAMLDAFLAMERRPELKGMSARTLRALWRNRQRVDARFRRDPGNRARFMALLREPRGVTHELRRMNLYGILGNIVPAFGRIVGQMQHDLFHVYTVDEHILMVIRNLRRFTEPQHAHEYPLCSRLIGDFKRKELLYLAGLFHDIAKGRGGDHSALGEIEARRFGRAHGLPAEDVDLVAWLVAQHLSMSATAQKQDISDPNVVAAFADRVGNERRLVALYLLTVADIRGTSPKVWNAWKAQLLEDLFYATRARLAGSTGGDTLADSLLARQREAQRLLRLYAVPDGAEQALWSRLDNVYFQRHTADEIAWHARRLHWRVDGDVPVVQARISRAEAGLQVAVYLHDQKDLFARISGYFGRRGLSIVEAKIHTTRHGYALDTFTVHDPADPKASYRDALQLVEFELAKVLAEQPPLEPPVMGRASRHLKHFPLTPEVQIFPDDKGTLHILEIVAGDRPGLLATIAYTLAKANINIVSAKINTLGERAEDVFLIDGARLHDEHALLRLETSLYEQLRLS